MKNTAIKKVVIVGGGTAGWMAAAMLIKQLGQTIRIELVESDAIGTIGVGEATIPPIQLFNNVLGINEQDFIKHTQGTYKLGIEFENWGQLGDKYMHAFGTIGRDLGMTPFHHYWLKQTAGNNASSLWDYSLNYQTAKANKFAALAKIPNTPLPGISHAYHFDASLYAKYLANFSQQLGVVRTEGKIVNTNLRTQDGFIESVTLESGQIINGDLFIDCSGFIGLLIEQALHTGYQDWSHYLPCDRAIAIPTTASKPIVPYTRSIAHSAGWQWRIPLQHRTGNGHVYSSKYISEQQALDTLLNNLDGEPLADPLHIKFTTGRRNKQWHKNCVALGLASGFLEPLESTSLHLVQSGITRLIKLFPNQGFAQSSIDEYNRQTKTEMEQIRDFIILHYKANQRSDSQFWRDCQQMTVPDSLQHKIELFKQSGTIFRHQEDLFSEVAWLQVMVGQNIMPQSYHPSVDVITNQQLTGFCQDLKNIFHQTAQSLPPHTP